MAYAALTSLLQTIEKTPQPAQQIITSFKEKVVCLLGILEGSSPKNNLTINNLEVQIRDASYDAEDVIESHMHQEQVLSKSVSCGVFSCFQKMISAQNSRSQTTDLGFQSLEKMIDEFDSILEALSKIKDAKVEDDLQRRISSSAAGPSRFVGASNKKSTDLVGIDEEMLQIKDWLTGHQSKLDIISIVGMGGIGKTTMVRNLYNDSLIQHHFDTRAWTIASQEYNVRDMLRRLWDTARHDDDELDPKKSKEQLGEVLYKSLKGRRYLIVIDDVWDTKTWDHVMRYFPDDNNGSRIILTTRLSEVAIYVNSSRSVHHMNLLNLTSSWTLLCKKVFGEEKCPSPPMEEIGKSIANSCKGLPLAIVVIGGILSRGSRTPEYWEHIAQNLKSAITENDDRFMDILSFSYNHLPHHLKACFLYMGVFPEDHVIFVSHLIKLWIAEGFIKPLTSKSLEDVAEDHLKDLVGRNLIMVHERKHNGGIKKCMIHDMLRGLCMKKAQDEKFLQVMDSNIQIFPEGKNNQRRVSIQSKLLYRRAKVHDLCVRSLLYFGKQSKKSRLLSFTKSFRMLRVLDALTIRFRKFPKKIGGLVHLRYLAFNYGGCSSKFPFWIFKLRNLQTLIVFGRGREGDTLHLPSSIWEMSQIRHILIDMCFLPYPFTNPSLGKRSIILENIQTLSEITDFRCTKKVFEIMPNLKKLGLSYSGVIDTESSSIEFNSFVYLHQLKTLKIRFKNHRPSFINFAFPPTLKKLTLSGCRLPWEEMTIVGSLPNLEVLKLKWHAFDGSVWEPNEGEFSKLKFLLISDSHLEHWRANDTHFPCLQHLSLVHCYKLTEIPSEIGEIPTLELLELYECIPSAVESAMVIQEEQQSLGNDLLNVIPSKDFSDHYLKHTSLGQIHREAAREEIEKYVLRVGIMVCFCYWCCCCWNECLHLYLDWWKINVFKTRLDRPVRPVQSVTGALSGPDDPHKTSWNRNAYELEKPV